jgi:hypothetical protein
MHLFFALLPLFLPLLNTRRVIECYLHKQDLFNVFHTNSFPFLPLAYLPLSSPLPSLPSLPFRPFAFLQDVSVPEAFKVEDFDPALVKVNYEIAKK